MSDDNGVHTVKRRPAKSGKVSYSDPITIHETSRTRVDLVPFFIPRTEGTELAIKLVSYQKANPPMTWVENDKKPISLREPAARKLLKGLKEHLAVAERDEDGSYIIIPVSEGAVDISAHNPSDVASALTKVLGQKEIVKHLADVELGDELTQALRGAIRLKEMQSAVSLLRTYLDSGKNDESVYQAWCEQHSWAFGNAYVMRDDVRDISTGDQLDLLLPTVISGYRDIVELKRPDMQVLLYDSKHRNFYFSADVSKAVGQCHRYLDVFHETAIKGLRDHPQIVAYHPRAIIVIGRSSDWEQEQLKALHGLNRRLSGVTVMTYDQLLAQGERLMEMLKGESTPGQDQEDEDPFYDPDITWDDDVPY